MTKILLIEDEEKVVNFIKQGLEEGGYQVDFALDGKEGMVKVLGDEYDLIILDIMLPELSGIDILKKSREKGLKTPILMLTARGTVEDRVNGLESGADDYLSKPFAFPELIARIQALLRRQDKELVMPLKVDDLILNPLTREVFRADKKIYLSEREYTILEYFMQNEGKVLTRTVLTEKIWDYHFDHGTNLIEVYINRLRSKVDEGFPTNLIHTIRGVGYVLKKEKE